MTPSATPTRTACFQPDNDRALELFAGRREILADLVVRLSSFLEPGAPSEARILVRGQRGIGKSMLSRKAIDEIRATHGPLTVTVDGARTGHGPEAFLRQLAKDLGTETLENATEPALQQSAELLLRFSSTTEVTVKQVREWTQSLKVGIDLKHRFLDKIGFEFALQRAAGATRKLEETHRRAVDTDLLRDLIQTLVLDCYQAEQTVVLFLDNLDQVGYAEIGEDVRRVTDLARYLLGMEGCVVIANLRSEFVSADLRKLYSLPVEVEGFTPAQLMELFEQRVQVRGEGTREKLEAAGMVAIAQRLAEWTDNAWGFLTWLAFLDYQRIDFDPGDGDRLRAALKRYADQSYVGVRMDETEKLARPYAMHESSGFLTKEELSAHGIADELLERATRYGVLVPDWLLSPDRYQLSPTLRFLTRQG